MQTYYNFINYILYAMHYTLVTFTLYLEAYSY